MLPQQHRTFYYALLRHGLASIYNGRTMSESRDMLDFAKALYWGLVFVVTLTGLYAVIFGIAEPFYWLLVPVAMALPGAWLARFPARVWIGFFVLAFVPAIVQSVQFVV
jgi:hypothetical protein